MKRKAECEDEPNKRTRATENVQDEFSKLPEIDVPELLQHGLKPDRYISAKVFMAWSPMNNKHRALVETANAYSPATPHKFEISFSGTCVQYFNVLELKTTDRILILLKGATLHKLPKPMSACTLPMKLCYEEGVVLKFLKRREGIKYDDQTIDTWKLKEAESNGPDDWYSTPAPRPHLELRTLPKARKPQENLTPVVSPVQQPTPDSIKSSVTEQPPPPPPQCEPQTRDDTTTPNVEATADVQRLSKRAQRRLDKELRKKHAAAEAKSSSLNGSAVGAGNIAIPEHHPQSPSPAVKPMEQVTVHPTPAVQSSKEVRIKVALRTPSHSYESIKRFEAGRLIHLIGVVTETKKPFKSRKGDWSCNLKLVDPTADISTVFSVNCFSKKYEEWVPNPDPGDVVILRNIKTSTFNNAVTGVGYGDKYQWAIFSPTTGQIHHGDRGKAPESEILADGFGAKYTPFCTYGEEEIKECLKLSDAWRILEKKRQAERGVVQQVGTSTPMVHSRIARQHRVICDAGPDVPPDGWFDCTVEVLYGHMNDNQVYSLYVTDYTANTGCLAVQGSWCPSALADYVLKVEMFQAAAEIGPKLLQNEYYSMKNLRMKISTGEYLEAKMHEGHRIHVADKGSPHLKALLDRKKQWELDKNASSSVTPEFEHRLFKDVPALDSHFNCTVEVLHVVEGAVNADAYIYVTDYTLHAEFAYRGLDADWARNLDGYIHKIRLLDEQVNLAKGLAPGSFCTIMRLRLRRSPVDGIVSGYLGGKQRSIQMLSPHNTTKEELRSLLVRKQEWNQALPTKSVVPQPSRSHQTIQEVVESKAPNKHLIRARVVDFWPFDLDDCFFVKCDKCQTTLRKEWKSCIDCGDFDHEFVRPAFRLFLSFLDAEGSILPVSVTEDCPFLVDLSLIDPERNHDTKVEFRKRIRPMIGNLVGVHKGLMHDETLQPRCDEFYFTICTWNTSTGSKGYALVNYED
ncbi:hypothetical protein BDN72DRAFT_830807 [Pluteus cervinus]|uniref:Uncharacterized protein n=1 Tax=Pluteus cervinus TaxID=181527 RepID=A0ACD3BDU1_9AGAR|nr:hypothetical protein BDN72DRAFT_830807 [Pluteus cervinus]